MPQVIPGKKGTDYRFVRYGDRIYVVYRVKLPNGKYVNTSWRVSKDDYKALGVDPSRVNRIGKADFQNLNVFGDASEIARGNTDVHPFEQYIHDLRERYGNVSWFDNKEFMSTMLMGWAENLSAAELEQQLKQTQWYQNRTDRARQWELEMSKEERQRETKLWTTRLMDTLDSVYGANVSWRESGIKEKELQEAARRIASGKWGDPSEGLEIWLRRQKQKAEKIEGTQAWIDRQQELEQQRAFANRPEDVQEKLRQEAFAWLGPRGVPDNQTLKGWASDIVSAKASEADWEKFMRQQAQSLYPWLGTNEKWQDRASTYKRILEEEWGQPVKWDNGLLYKIGETGANGEFTGKALSYDDFSRLARSRPEFWGGSTAKQEGFELFNYLNETFQGVGS